jgi:hypothetical protein
MLLWRKGGRKGGAAARMKKRGREGGRAATKGAGEWEGAARVIEEREPLDHRMQIIGPENSPLNQAPDPGKRMPKKIYCFSEVSAS